MRRSFLSSGVLGLVLLSTAVFGQENLERAKALYGSAAYDDALGVLVRLRTVDGPRAEVEQYRILCLVALGRVAEAEEAARAIVKTFPSFVPEAGEMPPRVVELFAKTRRELLPEIARTAYLDAKAALEKKDRAAALAGFEALVRLIDSAGADATGSLPELKILAAGFLDLSRALPVPAAETKTAATEPVKPGKAPEIIPPIAVRQTMPQWVPSDAMSRQASFSGVVRVSISAAGRVDTAAIEKSVHPAYDRLLLQAARSWEYRPATSDGVPVPSEQLVQVQLKPRQ
jgi:periplasmic protein TonB